MDKENKKGKFDLMNKLPKKPKNKKNANQNKWKKSSRTIFFWIGLFALTIIGFKILDDWGSLKERPVSYTEFQNIINDSGIKISHIYITISDRSSEIHGIINKKETSSLPYTTINNKHKPYERFVVKVLSNLITDKQLEEWKSIGIEVEFRERGLSLMSFVYSMLPWLLILFIWFIFIRQMQGGGGQKGIFSFGKSRAKSINPDRPQTTFKDVAGCDEAKEELQEIIDFLKNPDKYKKLGGKIPKGALLLGSPGTGKTLLARAVAGEAKVSFFSMSGSDFVEMFVGVGASRVRDLFKQSKENAPCIIFIDEIDAVGRHRGAGVGGGHDEREQTLNQLLVEMDGFESNEGVILIAATNRPDVLDPALLRPGRFDRQIVVDRPDINGRKGILKVHIKNIPTDDSVDLELIARGTPGLSGADIANLVNEAALLASRYNKEKVTMNDFEEAKDKVMMGAERKSRVITNEEKKIIAYHEAGHALVAKLVPLADPVHKITIIPRGMALGLTFSLPTDDRYINKKEYILSQIAIMLGGREAEWLIFNERSTGCSNDIERVTQMARRMVCEWGMSDVLGAVTFGKKDEEIFLGRSISQHSDYSESTAKLIDDEVHRIVNEQIERVKKLLAGNKKKLIDLSNAVLEHEILDGNEIDKILKGEKIENHKKEENKDKLNNDTKKDLNKKEENKGKDINTEA